MMLPMEQIQAAENGLDPTNLGGARGLKRSAQWPGGIVPYTIHSSASKIQCVSKFYYTPAITIVVILVSLYFLYTLKYF